MPWRAGERAYGSRSCSARYASHSRHPRPSPGHSQAHVGGRSGYFYHHQAALAQPNMACVRKRVLYHLFPKRPTCCLRGLVLARPTTHSVRASAVRGATPAWPPCCPSASMAVSLREEDTWPRNRTRQPALQPRVAVWLWAHH